MALSHPVRSLPTRAGYRHGIFMTVDKLQDLVKRVDTKRFLFAHNDILKEKLGPTPAIWVYLLNTGQCSTITVATSHGVYKPHGSNNESIICLELYGLFLNEEWFADQDMSNIACFQLLKNVAPTILANEENLSSISEVVWQNLRDEVVQACQTTTTGSQVYSCMISVIYSICRTGSPSENTKRKIATEIQVSKNITIAISDTVVKEYWNMLGRQYNQSDIQQLMVELLAQFEGSSIALTNLVEFAKKRNLTQYYSIMSAMDEVPEYPWNLVYLSTSQEFKALTKAAQFIGDKDYMGYGSFRPAEAQNFPNLSYLGVQICQRVLGQRTLSAFATTMKDRVNAEKWDNQITKFLRDRQEAIVSHQEASRANYQVALYLEQFKVLRSGAASLPPGFPNLGAGASHPGGPNDDDDGDDNQPPGGGSGAGAIMGPSRYHTEPIVDEADHASSFRAPPERSRQATRRRTGSIMKTDQTTQPPSHDDRARSRSEVRVSGVEGNLQGDVDEDEDSDDEENNYESVVHPVKEKTSIIFNPDSPVEERKVAIILSHAFDVVYRTPSMHPFHTSDLHHHNDLLIQLLDIGTTSHRETAKGMPVLYAGAQTRFSREIFLRVFDYCKRAGYIFVISGILFTPELISHPSLYLRLPDHVNVNLGAFFVSVLKAVDPEAFSALMKKTDKNWKTAQEPSQQEPMDEGATAGPSTSGAP